MKRLVLVLTMLCGLASYAPAAVAATAHPGLPRLAQYLPSGAARNGAARELIPLSASRSPAHSGVITSAQQLRLDPKYLGSGNGWTMTEDRPMSIAEADTQTIQGTVLHPTISYQNLGAVGLYYEESSAPVQNSLSYYFITYLASYYTTADNATAAYTDAISGWQTATPQQCQLPASLPSPHQCSQVVFTPQNPPLVIDGLTYKLAIRVIQVSNALFEFGYALEVSPVNIFDQNVDVGNSNLDFETQGIEQLFAGGTPSPTATPPTVTPPPTLPPTVPPTSTPTPTPTQTPISYGIRAQWEKPSKQPNPNSKLTKAKHGTKVEPIVFINVDSAPASQPLSVKMVIKRGSKTVLSKSGNFNLDSQDPTGLYDFGFTWKAPSKTGTYKLNTTVTMGTLVAKSSANLKVT